MIEAIGGTDIYLKRLNCCKKKEGAQSEQLVLRDLMKNSPCPWDLGLLPASKNKLFERPA